MIEVSEELIPIGRTPELLPFPSRKVHPSTCVRWAMQGVGRQRIKLETKMIGGRRFTSKQAVLRFIDRLSGDAARTGDLSGVPADAHRQGE
ncbi:MAG: DUF1580 domain-containing protein [Gemmataceae bacterium]